MLRQNYYMNYTAVIDNIINFLSKKSEPNSNTSENSVLTLIALGAAVFILSLLAEYEKRKQFLLFSIIFCTISNYLKLDV